MSTQTFLLPDVGEGLTEAEIVSWRVAPGDTVDVNDVLVEIETAKSLVELPSPFAGTVGELLVAEGDTVERRSADHHDRLLASRPRRSSARASTASRADPHAEGEGAVLVGYGTGGHVPVAAPQDRGDRAGAGRGIRRHHREAPDPQARPRSRGRPHRRDAQRPGR